MESHHQLVLDAMKCRKRVLLLGQLYLGRDILTNPLMAAFRSSIDQTLGFYEAWLQSADTLSERAERVSQLSKSISIPEANKLLLRLPWTSVVTSCIDPIVRRALEVSDARTVQQVYGLSGRGSGDESHIRLLRLFGSVEAQFATDLPPSNKDGIRRRRNEISSVLSQLPEMVTPKGCLLLEGWNPVLDWLRVRDLASALASFTSGQVLIFGVSSSDIEVLHQDEDFRDVLEHGTVVLIPDTLSCVVEELQSEGLLLGLDIYSADATGQIYTVLLAPPAKNIVELCSQPKESATATVMFPRLRWHNYLQRLNIIDSIDPRVSLPNDDQSKYDHFKKFTMAKDAPPDWRYLEELSFRRNAVDGLLKECARICSYQAPQDHTIILCGQSGSGKTIVMQQLALGLRRTGLPVLHIAGGALLSSPLEIIDEFARDIETVSSAPIFIIYDANSEEQEYIDLSNQFAARGRKCVVIGSVYPAQTEMMDAASPRSQVEAKVHYVGLKISLDETAEREAYVSLFQKYIPGYDRNAILELLGGDVSHFFAGIYRLLPDVRGGLERGLKAEFAVSMEKLRKRLVEAKAEQSVGNQCSLMQYAFQEAFRGREQELDALLSHGGEGIVLTSADQKDAYDIINAVMLVSRMGIRLPQAIALRLVHGNFRAYTHPDDIIIETDLADGSTELAARHPLEADIWIRDKLSMEPDQFDMICRIVREINPGEIANDQSTELDFVVRVLQAVGPQGKYKMTRFYLRIADLIKGLEEDYGEIHPRLLLIQSNAIRESLGQWVDTASEQVDKSTEVKMDRVSRNAELLSSAETAIVRAISILMSKCRDHPTGGSRRLLSVLETERASILGYQIGNVRRAAEKSTRLMDQFAIQKYYSDARRAWLHAMELDETNFKAMDSGCWISYERVCAPFSSETEQASVLVEWMNLLESYKSLDIPPSLEDQRDRREMRLLTYLKDKSKIDILITETLKRNEASGHALRAWQIAQEIPGIEGKSNARSYLESATHDLLYSESAILHMYIRLWWETETGFGTHFPHERLRLPFDHKQWNALREMHEANLQFAGYRDNGISLFYIAGALMHMDETRQALGVLDHLNRLNIGGYRRARVLLLMTNDIGEPRQYVGEYRGQRRGSWLVCWCDELRAEVPFNPFVFGSSAMQPGTHVGPFHIAFNYRGIHADPVPVRRHERISPSV